MTSDHSGSGDSGSGHSGDSGSGGGDAARAIPVIPTRRTPSSRAARPLSRRRRARGRAASCRAVSSRARGFCGVDAGREPLGERVGGRGQRLLVASRDRPIEAITSLRKRAAASRASQRARGERRHPVGLGGEPCGDAGRDPRRSAAAGRLVRVAATRQQQRARRREQAARASASGSPLSRISSCVRATSYSTRRNDAVPASKSSSSQAARGSPSRGWPTEPGLSSRRPGAERRLRARRRRGRRPGRRPRA